MFFNRRAVFVILCVLLVTSLLSTTAFAQMKLGYIRPQYIFQQYEPYTEAQRALEEFQKTEMGKLEAEGKLFEQNYQEYQQQSMVMSEDMQQQKQNELLTQQQALEQAYDELTRPDGLIDKRQEELIAPIIEDINEILMNIGENEDYDFIFDASAGGVIYSDEQYDLSDQVIEELNTGLPTE